MSRTSKIIILDCALQDLVVKSIVMHFKVVVFGNKINSKMEISYL